MPFWMGLVISTLPLPTDHDIADKYCQTVKLEPVLINNKEDVRLYVAASLRPRVAPQDLPQAGWAPTHLHRRIQCRLFMLWLCVCVCAMCVPLC